MRMKQVFDFNDITLLPQFSYVESRSECDTKIKFGKHTFKSPVVPANMESIIDVSLAVKLSEKGYFYILHILIPNQFPQKNMLLIQIFLQNLKIN